MVYSLPFNAAYYSKCPHEPQTQFTYTKCKFLFLTNLHQMQVPQITVMLVVGENWLKTC